MLHPLTQLQYILTRNQNTYKIGIKAAISSYITGFVLFLAELWIEQVVIKGKKTFEENYLK